MEGVCRSHYFAVFCITQPTASSQQWGAYGGTMRSDYRVMGNADVLSTEYKAYQGTVYEPFNDTPPSKIRGRRNGDGEDDYTGDGYNDDFTWGGDGEGSDLSNPGQGPTGSPVGEPWILLLFAAVAAVFVAIRKKEPTPALPKGKE